MRAAWWWIDRWRKSTAYTDMTAEQQGIYRNLLDELWLRDGVLPLSEKALSQISGDSEAWPRVRDVVLARFVKTDAGYHHLTHDEVSAQSRGYREAQADAGRARAAKAARGKNGRLQPAGPAGKSSQDQPDVQPEHQPTDQPPSPSPSPSQNTDSITASLRSAGADKPRRAKKPRQEATGPHHEAIRLWDALWRDLRGEAYAWNGKEATGIQQALQAAGGDLAAFGARARRLLEDPPDAWYAQNASPTILASKWNQLAVRVTRRAPTQADHNREASQQMAAWAENPT